MADAFTLHRLPPTVLTTILQSMDTLERVSFSFVSKRTKALVVSLNLKVCSIVLRASRTFDIQLYFGFRIVTFVLCQENDEIPARWTTAHRVTVYEGRRSSYWTKEGYGVRNWIDHLMTITHASKIDQMEFLEDAQTFDVASIQNITQGLEIRKLVSEDSSEYQQAVLEAFLMKNVSVRILPNQNPERLSKVFMQNYDSIEISLWPELKLNELLIINSRIIDIMTRTTNTIHLLNQFLKLWKTGSSSRLEYLRIFVLDPGFILDVNIILKGIKHTIVEKEIIRYFDVEAGPNRGKKLITGGFDIQGMNGRKATICIFSRTCEVFFWPQ